MYIRAVHIIYTQIYRHSSGEGPTAENVAPMEKFLPTLEQGTRKRESAR